MDEGGYVLALASGHFVFIRDKPLDNTLLISVVVAMLPFDDDEETTIYRQLFESHLLSEATSGATFAIDPDGDELILYRRLPVAKLTATDFGNPVMALATTAMRLAEQMSIPAPASVMP